MRQRRLSIVQTGATVLLLALGPIACDQVRGRLRAHDGSQAYRVQNYEDAVQAYTDALGAIPGEPDLRRNLALSHLAAARQSGEPGGVDAHLRLAVSLLRDSVEQSPSSEAVELLLNAWIESGRLGDAAEYFSARAARTQTDEDWRLLGLVEAQRGNYRGAIAAYEERIRLHPNDAGPQAALATLSWEFLHAGGPDDDAQALAVADRGEAAAREADRLDPNHASALVYAGLLRRERAARQSDPTKKAEDLAEAETLLARVRARQDAAP